MLRIEHLKNVVNNIVCVDVTRNKSSWVWSVASKQINCFEYLEKTRPSALFPLLMSTGSYIIFCWMYCVVVDIRSLLRAQSCVQLSNESSRQRQGQSVTRYLLPLHKTRLIKTSAGLEISYFMFSTKKTPTAEGPIQKLAGSRYPMFSRDRLVTSTWTHTRA